ncbi:MAG TPA: class I adenylate-forming enzyme family protein, partial [Chthoniobacterales bacterium]|nr:class I adenylate-forming enzyme family protein [Chthoniobacterales bacterium]
MKQRDVLLERWQEILARKGDSPAIFDTAGKAVRTFRQIEKHAADHARIEANKPPCHVTAMQGGNHMDSPSLFLASLRMEHIFLPVDESASPRQVNDAVSVSSQAADTDWAGKPPVLFKLTSGTTSLPRMIRFRSEQLLADCDQICDTMGMTDADLNFGVIPVSHSYGFSNLLTPLIARGVPIVISRDRTPRAVLDDLARTGATVFPGMPVFYQAFCEMADIPKLPRLRLCISAGAPLPIAVAQKFREKFGLSIHSFYGASECGGICYDRDAKNEVEGFVGMPMKGVDLELIDPNSESSQIRVRS